MNWNKYHNEIRGTKMLDKDEEIQVFTEYKNGDMESYNSLIDVHRVTVFNIANNYYFKNKSIPLDELIAIGHETLLNCLINYKVGIIRFYSYLNASMIKEFLFYKTNQSIRIPYNRLGAFYKFNVMNIPDEELEDRILEMGYHKSYYLGYLKYKNNFDSLDERYPNSSDYKIDIATYDIDNESTVHLYRLIDKLEYKHKFIIENYFGLNGDKMNSNQIGYELKLSGTTIMTELKKALFYLKRLDDIHKDKYGSIIEGLMN